MSAAVPPPGFVIPVSPCARSPPGSGAAAGLRWASRGQGRAAAAAPPPRRGSRGTDRSGGPGCSPPQPCSPGCRCVPGGQCRPHGAFGSRGTELVRERGGSGTGGPSPGRQRMGGFGDRTWALLRPAPFGTGRRFLGKKKNG